MRHESQVAALHAPARSLAVLVGLLVNPNNPNAEADTNNARIAADELGRKRA